jgi:hypothetical protein
MKKSELKTMVRHIVREEVAMAINEVVTELKQPTFGDKPIGKLTNVNDTLPKQKRKKIVKEKQHFTSNSMLNDVLNETAGDDWETLSGGTFDSSQMNNVLKNQYSDMVSGNSQIPQTDINDKPVTDLSDTLMNNLTKDYSSVLKSMEKSANQLRGN